MTLRSCRLLTLFNTFEDDIKEVTMMIEMDQCTVDVMNMNIVIPTMMALARDLSPCVL